MAAAPRTTAFLDPLQAGGRIEDGLEDGNWSGKPSSSFILRSFALAAMSLSGLEVIRRERTAQDFVRQLNLWSPSAMRARWASVRIERSDKCAWRTRCVEFRVHHFI